jgi:GWxTD domain-containing protein
MIDLRKWMFLPCLIILCASAASGQQRITMVSSPFELSVGQSLSEDGEVLLSISTAIEYRRLVFFRRPSGYLAEYRIYFDLRDDDGRRVRGEVSEESVAVTDYEMTRSSNLFSRVKRSLPVEPGEYKLMATIEVMETSRKYVREAEIEVFGTEHGRFKIASPVYSIPGPSRLGEKPPPGELPLSLCSDPIPAGFRAMPGEVFADLEGWIRMSIALQAPTEGRTSTDILVSMKVTGPDDLLLSYNRSSIDVDRNGRAVFCLDLNVDEMPIGYYEVSVSASVPHTSKKTFMKSNFTILLGRAMFDAYFDDMLELLSYVIGDDEISALEAAPPGRRVEEWSQIWAERDPTSTTGMNEDLSRFLGRLRYAVERFGRHGPGWKADMGRIYIRYGPPDKELEGGGSTLGSKRIIWYYYSEGIAFIFEDSIGAGIYRLMDTRSI